MAELKRPLIGITPHEKLAGISEFGVEKLNDLLGRLESNKFVRGILWGGSLAYKDNASRADVDLFCLIENLGLSEHSLVGTLHLLGGIEVVINQGFFPWTNKLYTIYYRDDPDFSIDVSLVDHKDAESFFWEPEGTILWDRDGMIAKSRALQMSQPTYTWQPFLKDNPFSLAVIALKKIEKNLSRNHLWNALEQLSIMRRYIMQIIRLEVIHDTRFLGSRVDRDIEDVIPHELNMKLAGTTAVYNESDIALKAIALSGFIESLLPHFIPACEGNILEWLNVQLQHEVRKLQTYIK